MWCIIGPDQRRGGDQDAPRGEGGREDRLGHGGGGPAQPFDGAPFHGALYIMSIMVRRCAIYSGVLYNGAPFHD